jgi:hypothetical protein
MELWFFDEDLLPYTPIDGDGIFEREGVDDVGIGG